MAGALDIRMVVSLFVAEVSQDITSSLLDGLWEGAVLVSGQGVHLVLRVLLVSCVQINALVHEVKEKNKIIYKEMICCFHTLLLLISWVTVTGHSQSEVCEPWQEKWSRTWGGQLRPEVRVECAAGSHVTYRMS